MVEAQEDQADSLAWNQQVQIAEDVSAALIRRERDDGTVDMRFRLTERKSVETWSTKLTVHAPADPLAKAWIWLDVDAPVDANSDRRRWTGTPGLASNLVDVLEARDGDARLASQPAVVRADDVEDLAVMICGSQEAQRRGLMFVAASANDSTMSFGAWRDHAQQVLRHTTGLASSFILDPEATTELRGALGRTHAVEPWTIRTFRPDADPADESDALRHRVLSTGRLASDDPAYLARLLGWRAREAALDTPLQSSALRLERDLDRAYDEMLMQSAFTKVMPDADAAGAGKERVSPSDELGVAERPRRAQRTRETLHVSGRQRGDAQLIKRLSSSCAVFFRMRNQLRRSSTNSAYLRLRALAAANPNRPFVNVCRISKARRSRWKINGNRSSCAELERELDEVTYMGEQSIVGDASFVSTLTRESSHRQNRKRGRGPDDGQYDSTCA